MADVLWALAASACVSVAFLYLSGVSRFGIREYGPLALVLGVVLLAGALLCARELFRG